MQEKNRFSPEFKKKSIRSYVVRSGRITAGQLKALESHWQQYRLSLFDAAPGSWQEVFHRQAPVVLEIGFGMGDSLLALAISQPDMDFVGIDVYPPGAGKLVSQAVEHGVSNLKIYLADAVDVIDDCIPEQSLSRVQIFFPDPWHKKKHHKRRLIQTTLVEKIYCKLIPGGLLHLATDWQPYAEHMVDVIEGVAGFKNMAQQGVYSQRPDFRSETKFERRGRKLGHGVWDLVYKRTA
ncbi:MAG: tRNA (guanosine(46)-N7)-methyltransferase TrmB [Gammaproteobacteria bacterium]|nr:MAG: tRNA (guanosine(46)-N7)-methyltransferase TrmB [Gammaproteobacteria bacterium]RLA54382.1 MAG: tRNA (guanosine(46)-N7)-methyltransferase TrmB [Gammaproteobacteria bacterium]